jgi:serine/threonine-protein kinase RsbW
MGNPEAGNHSEQRSAALASAMNGEATSLPKDLPACDQHAAPARQPELRASALRWRRAFPGDDAQISVLRRWLECLLPPCSSRDDLTSVAVELGTNAVRHTASGSGGQFVVVVTFWMQMTRVAVYDDGSPNNPRLTEDLLCEYGRGLLMVNALSVRMGVGGTAQGRVVWADIPWTGQDIPSQLEFPEGLAFVVHEAEADLAYRYPGVLIWPDRPEARLSQLRLSACDEQACRT